MSGLKIQLIPWLDNAENVSTKSLLKPKTFAEAEEMEKECVLFAKVKCRLGVDSRNSNLREIFLVDIIVCIESQQCEILRQSSGGVNYVILGIIVHYRNYNCPPLFFLWKDDK